MGCGGWGGVLKRLGGGGGALPYMDMRASRTQVVQTGRYLMRTEAATAHTMIR